MKSHWTCLKNKNLNYKIAFDNEKNVFNTVLLGKNCPLSKCCKMTVCFQFNSDIGGKVLCMDALCPFNPLDTFFIDLEILAELFTSFADDQQNGIDASIVEPINPDIQK